MLFQRNFETIKLIDSQTIQSKLESLCRGEISLNIVETILDAATTNNNKQKTIATARLGVCLALIHQAKNCTTQQLKKFIQASNQPWNFNPSEFYSTTAPPNDILSPVEYVFRFSTNIKIINPILDSIVPDDKNDIFFSQRVYDNLDIDRKQMFLTSGAIDINHQHSTESPALVLNRVFIKNSDNAAAASEEIEALLNLGARTNLLDQKCRATFIQLACTQLTKQSLLDLVGKLNHVTALRLLLYWYETNDISAYDGLYFTFSLFFKFKDNVDLKDIISYLFTIQKSNIGEGGNKEKYLDAYIYSSYIKYIATLKTNEDNQSLQKVNSLLKIIYDKYPKTIKLKNLIESQSNNIQIQSKYRINPKDLPFPPPSSS